MQTAIDDARAALAALKDGDGSKQQEYNELKRELAKAQKELAAKEAEIEVSHPYQQTPGPSLIQSTGLR